MKKEHFELMREGLAQLSDGLGLGDEIIEAALYTTEIVESDEIIRDFLEGARWLQGNEDKESDIFELFYDYVEKISSAPRIEILLGFNSKLKLKAIEALDRRVRGEITTEESSETARTISRLLDLSSYLYNIQMYNKHSAFCDGDKIYINGLYEQGLRSELIHRILHILGLREHESVSEFYDMVGSRIFGLNEDPEKVKVFYRLGELNIGKPPKDRKNLLAECDVDILEHFLLYPFHAEGVYIFKRLEEKYVNRLVGIAADALKNPKIDFSDPKRFTESVIGTYD